MKFVQPSNSVLFFQSGGTLFSIGCGGKGGDGGSGRDGDGDGFKRNDISDAGTNSELREGEKKQNKLDHGILEWVSYYCFVSFFGSKEISIHIQEHVHCNLTKHSFTNRVVSL